MEQGDTLTALPKQLKDEDTAGSAFENEEEVRRFQYFTNLLLIWVFQVLFYTEVSAPAVIKPSSELCFVFSHSVDEFNPVLQVDVCIQRQVTL